MKNPADAQVDQYLNAVTEEMTFSEARAGVRKELRSHIEDQVEVAWSIGVSKSDAVDDALRRMGPAQALGSSLNQIHQPKFDFVLPVLALLLSAIGLWNLSGSRWAGLQALWILIGVIVLSIVYFLPVKVFKNLLASLYGVAILGLGVAHLAGEFVDGQPYLSVAGLNIKMADLAGALLALGFPALDLRMKAWRIFSKNGLSVATIGLFLSPMIYFSHNGFVWPGLLFLVSGLCYLGMSGLSTVVFIGSGLVGAGMLASRFADSIVSIPQLDQAIVANAHTDFALSSLGKAMFAEALAASLLMAIVIYGAKVSFSIKDVNLRALALVGNSLLTVQILTGVLANLGLFPMISAGISVPFISYGGSGIVANFLVVGVLIGCLKRKSVSEVAETDC